jgi:hypothetical protein
MIKNKGYYFKRAFFFALPIAVFVIVFGLFDIDFSDVSELLKLFGKGVFVGLITGVILGLINVFAKVDTLFKKE